MKDTEYADMLKELGWMSPSGSGDPLNFIFQVLKYINIWMKTYQWSDVGGKSPYVCFIGAERVNTVVKGLDGFVLRRQFRDDCPVDLPGGLYLGAYSLNSVYSNRLEPANVDECIDFMLSLDLGDVPMVVFNAATSRVHIRKEGSDEFDSRDMTRPTACKVTSSNFDNILNDFHRDHTQQPSGHVEPWDSGVKRILRAKLEGLIQRQLYLELVHLSDYDPGVIVLIETHHSLGRADILVHLYHERMTIYSELKVLKGWVSSTNKDGRRQYPEKDRVEWAKRGIVQAHLYKKERNPNTIAYTLCYDGQSKDVELEGVPEFAEEKGVLYRRYFMYASSREHQDAILSS